MKGEVQVEVHDLRAEFAHAIDGVRARPKLPSNADNEDKDQESEEDQTEESVTVEPSLTVTVEPSLTLTVDAETASPKAASPPGRPSRSMARFKSTPRRNVSHPTTGFLVTILSGRNLAAMDSNGLSDPYIKVRNEVSCNVCV